MSIYSDSERATNSAIVHTSWDADNAWQAELVRVYGRAACNARYDARGTATPALAALHAEKSKAREAEAAMWNACIARDRAAAAEGIGA